MAGAWTTPTAIHSKCGEDALYPASHTIDESLSTYWKHSIGHEHWIIFDMGSTKTVQKVRFYCYGGTYLCICAVSAVYINDTADESGGSKGSLSTVPSGDNWNEIDVVNTNGRYIKLKLKTYETHMVCQTTHGLDNLKEFEAYV